ncbi:MAG: hypothetical protein L6R41_006899 [Letrouitia leprolyta]|nr:MAG: hypothetical protein L6R41_006899 [Letrouitia leprolyta]
METIRRAPSRTFVPLALPIDIIDFPKLLHPRIAIAIRISAPIFMGGATVEGVVELTIDGGPRAARGGRKQAPISIDRISVALVGIEQSGARQHMFRCLMTDLIDEAHLPPIEMARPNQPVSDQLWEVMPSRTGLPFRINLPVRLGPPPFHSKKNSIRYSISVLVEAKIDGRRTYVRRSEEVVVLTVHDPEKALVNLPNPLVVTDEVQSSHRGSLETVILTAGIHRQTWIGGYPLFVDIRVSNRGSKIVRKVELQLERSTFVYAHAAPSDEEGLGDTLRLPDKCEKEVIYKAICPGWQIVGRSSNIKTCSLFVPSCLVSVDEDTSYNYRAGQAFLAARHQSLEQVNRETLKQEKVDDLSHLLDEPVEPKIQQQPHRRASTSYIGPRSNPNEMPRYRTSKFQEGSENFRNLDPLPQSPRTADIAPPPPRPPPAIPKRRTHRPSVNEQPSRQRLLDRQAPSAVQPRRMRSSLEDRRPRGPRLQRSTSGLKFSSSEDNDMEIGNLGCRERRSIRGL